MSTSLSRAPFARPTRRRPLFAAVALALSLPFAAQAQDGQSHNQDTRHDEARDLDRVVVTASPLRQTAEELSQPVEVLTGERLDRAKSATLGETLDGLPGVQTSNFGAGVGRPIIRGLDGPRIGVLSGGLSNQDVSTISQDHATTIEPFLADQIEVIKGPATLLYGSGAIGGVVNVVDGRIHERPLTETLSGRAELRYDSVSRGRTAMARFDAMGADGLLALHADGVYRDLEDYDTPDGEQENSFVRTRTGALGASWVGDDGFFGVSFSRFDNRYGNPGEPGDAEEGEPPVTLDMLQNRFEAKGGLNRDFWIFDGLRVGFANTDYEHIEFEGDEIGTRFISDANEGRVELTHRALGAWTGAIGFQTGERTFEAVGEEAFVPRTRTRANGLFWMGHGEWGAFQLDAGIRGDRVRTDAIGQPRRSFTPLSLAAGALWRFNDAWRLSLNLDRAERAPAEEELYADGPHAATGSYEIGDPTMREERANQIELGLHYHGARIDAKVSVYHTRFDGFIYLFDTGEFFEEEEESESVARAKGAEGPLPIRVWTQDDATFRGIEGEIVARLVDGDAGRLNLRTFGDHVRGELNDGGNLPRIAPSRFGMELNWDSERWRAGIGATRVFRQNDVAANELETDGYTFVDASIAWHWDTDRYGGELFLDGHNLGDADARVHTSFLRDKVQLPGRSFSAGIRLFF